EPSGEPHIAFSAYGRRQPRVHDAVRSLVRELGGHYDYTTTSQSLAAGTNPQDHYDIYAWHLRNSWFPFGWSVETTDSAKEHRFSPVTCRWFEAAACGTVILGDAPRDPIFPFLFGDRLIQRLNPAAGAGELRSTLMDLWERRRALREEALQLRQ